MSNKTTTHTTDTGVTAKFCAFWGLVFSAVAGVVSFFFWLLVQLGVQIAWAGTVISICNLLSMLGMLVGVGLAAWSYVRGKSKGWKVVFWVAFALYVLGILGIFKF